MQVLVTEKVVDGVTLWCEFIHLHSHTFVPALIGLAELNV